jgi:FAD-dependent urate hydroxylase
VSQDVEVAVIGAGPHGLSAAIHLRRAGIAAHTLGEPMSFWQGMPKGMRLRSNMTATNLVETDGPFSLASYMADTGESFGHPVSLRRFVEYGRWVQRNGVPDLDTRTVTGLVRDNGSFALELSDGGRLDARRVVVACGIAPFERIPERFRQLPSNLASHTGHHDDLSVFAGKRIAIVGSGQSALECAVLAMERGADVEIIARRSEMTWLRNWSPIQFMGPLRHILYAPTDVGPLWYSRLVATPALFTRLPRETQDRIAYRSIRPACSYFVKVRIDGIKWTMGTEVTGAEESGEGLRLALTDGTQREVDHLMFGTGYKIDVTRYPFLSEGLLSELKIVDGYPVLGRGFETSVPRLHMLGAPAARSFGPTLRFVSGSWYSGSRLAGALAPSKRRALGGLRSNLLPSGQLA